MRFDMENWESLFTKFTSLALSNKHEHDAFGHGQECRGRPLLWYRWEKTAKSLVGILNITLD